MKTYADNGWKRDDGTAFPNIQSLARHLVDNEGTDPCSDIDGADCVGDKLHFDKCQRNPRAGFFYFAMAHWGQWLQLLHNKLTGDAVEIGFKTSTLVSEFFTPEQDPTTLLIPVSVINGIAGGISGFFGPAAVVAGAGTIATGFLTQAGLDKPE